MAIYNSYSDFSTKDGGVIEGLGGGRKKGKVGTLYQKVSNLTIKPQYKLVKSVANVNAISRYRKDMDQKRIKLLKAYLFKGGIAKMRGSIFVRYSQKGLCEVYADPLNSEAPKSTKLVKSDKIEKQKQKD